MEPSKDLSALLDRSEADVRGVKKRLSSGGGSATKSVGHARNGSAASSNFDSGSRSGQSSRRESAFGESVGGKSLPPPCKNALLILAYGHPALA